MLAPITVLEGIGMEWRSVKHAKNQQPVEEAELQRIPNVVE